MLRNNCTEDNFHCTPAIPNIIVNAADVMNGGSGNQNPAYRPLFAKDAWNERSWHSMRKALNAARVADNAVKEAFRYKQWSKDRGKMLEAYAEKALAAFEKEVKPSVGFGGDLALRVPGAGNGVGSARGEPPPLPEGAFADYQGLMKTAHWF